MKRQGLVLVPTDARQPVAETPCSLGAREEAVAWTDADALRATHLCLASAAFLASVITVIVGCALQLLR